MTTSAVVLSLLPLSDYSALVPPLLVIVPFGLSLLLSRRALFPSLARYHRLLERRSKGFWFTLAVLVGPVWAITPACWALVAWRGIALVGWAPWTGGESTGRTALDVLTGWAVLEVLFSLLHHHLSHLIQPPPPPRSSDSATTLRSTFLRVLRASMLAAPPSSCPSSPEQVLLALGEHEREESDRLWVEEREGEGGEGREELVGDVLREDFVRLKEGDERAVAFRERFILSLRIVLAFKTSN